MATFARQRKPTTGGKILSSNDQKLIKRLESLWESAGTLVKRVSREDYVDSLLDRRFTNEKNLPTSKTAAFKWCLKIFDCAWIAVLLVLAVWFGFYLFPTILNFVSAHGHSRLYDITRFLRFIYIALQPYIIVDLSHSCIVSNPFSNGFLACPCLVTPHPIVIQHTANTPLSSEVLYNSTYYVNLIRSAVLVNDGSDYGRSTLVKIFNTTHLLPKPCSQYATDDMSFDVNYYSLGSDELYWNDLKSKKEPWSFSWLECPDSVPSIWSLLPDHHHLFREGNWTEVASFFLLSSQWAPSAAPFCADADGRLLLVLKGTLQIMVDPSSEHCTESCMPYAVRELYTLSEGDALSYNVKHWIITDKTWSNTSFAVLSCLKF